MKTYIAYRGTLIVFALLFLREIPTVRELVGGAVILGIAFYSSLHSEDES